MFPKSSYCWFLALLCLCASEIHALQPRQVEQLLTRVAATALDPSIRSNRNTIRFTRESIIEELSDKGKTHSKEAKTYRVYPLAGIPYHRLIQVNNRVIPADEQARKETEAKRESQEGKEKGNRRRDFQVSAEILARYSFAFDSYDTFLGRKVVVLNFRPKNPPLTANNIYERVLNSLGGTLRIDPEDAEIVSADIKLLEKVKLWGGFVGNLDLFQLHVTKRRVLPGVWLNEQTFLEIGGRKLLSGMRYRIFEQCKDFQAR